MAKVGARRRKAAHRAADEILCDIGATRARIRVAKATLEGLYAEQNRLYVEGYKAGIPFAHMARAGGEHLAVRDQAVRAVIRREMPETRQAVS